MIRTDYVVIFGFFKQQFHVGEIVGYEESAVPYEIENVSKHLAVAIDEIVLFQTVQHDRDATVEHFGQAGIGESGQRFK